MNALPRRTSVSLVSLLLAAAVLTGGAGAVQKSPKTHVWTGAYDSKWSNSQNWDDGEAPSDGDIVYLTGTGHPDITDVAGIHLSALYMEAHSMTGSGILTVGNLVWTRGTIAMDLSVLTAGTILGEATYARNATNPDTTTLVNSGVIGMGPGVTLHLDFGAKIENMGTWSASKISLGTDNTIQSNVCCSELAVFQNSGTLSATGAGRLTLSNMGYDGTRTGSVEGKVTLGYGTDLLENGTKVTGQGTNLTITDKAQVAADGTLNLDDGATMTQDGAATLAPGPKPLVFKGSGSADGTYRWLSGTITASPTFGDKTSLVLDSPGTKTLGDGVKKHGQLTLTTSAIQRGTGTLYLDTASRITNNGTWSVPAGQHVTIAGMVCCANPSAFRNFAKLEIDPTASLTFNQDQFANASQGVISGGALILGTGLHLLRNGTTLNGSNASIRLTNKGTVDGSGKVELKNGGTFLLGGGSTVTGSLDLEGSGVFLWSEGTVGGQLDAGAGVKTQIDDVATDHAHERAVSSADPKHPAQLIVEGGAVQHSLTPISVGPGTETWNRIGSTWKVTGGGFGGGVCCAFPAKLINLGTMDVEAAKPVAFGQLQFSNRGTLKVGSGTLAFSGVNPTQFAGTTEVAGTLTASEYVLQGGDLLGSGTIGGNLTNRSGTVSPGSPIGKLTVTGTYAQGTGGKFTADLTKSAGDLLDAGTADLAGTLVLHPLHGKLARKPRTLVHAHMVTRPFTVTKGLPSLGGAWKVVTAGGTVSVEPS